MANSSDWIGALTAEPPAQTGSESDWMARLPSGGAFVEGLPFGRPPLAKPDQDPVGLDFDLEDLAQADAALLADPFSETNSEPEPQHDPVADAFAKGEAAGRAAAEADHAAAAQHMRAVRLTFQALDQTAMDALASDLAETVMALCSQAMGDCAIDPSALAQRCSAAASRLGTAAAECSLHLNPADIDLLDPKWRAGWTITPDDQIERGGLRFEAPNGSISDGPPEWRRAIAAALRG